MVRPAILTSTSTILGVHLAWHLLLTLVVLPVEETILVLTPQFQQDIVEVTEPWKFFPSRRPLFGKQVELHRLVGVSVPNTLVGIHTVYAPKILPSQRSASRATH
jgi:hypothetical protein